MTHDTVTLSIVRTTNDPFFPASEQTVSFRDEAEGQPDSLGLILDEYLAVLDSEWSGDDLRRIAARLEALAFTDDAAA